MRVGGWGDRRAVVQKGNAGKGLAGGPSGSCSRAVPVHARQLRQGYGGVEGCGPGLSSGPL